MQYEGVQMERTICSYFDHLQSCGGGAKFSCFQISLEITGTGKMDTQLPNTVTKFYILFCISVFIFCISIKLGGENHPNSIEKSIFSLKSYWPLGLKGNVECKNFFKMGTFAVEFVILCFQSKQDAALCIIYEHIEKYRPSCMRKVVSYNLRTEL